MISWAGKIFGNPRQKSLPLGKVVVFTSVRVGSHSHFFEPVAQEACVTQNLTYDGTNWNLDDTTAPGAIMALFSGNSGFFYATAGANPRTVFTGFEVTANGTAVFGKGVANDGAGFKHQRVTTGSIAGGGMGTITVTWSTAFADASYTISVNVLQATNPGLRVPRIVSQVAGSCVIQVVNDSVGALTGTLHVIAIHD